MLLAGTSYDPVAAGSFATTAAAQMTAVDTTNLRLTFAAPSGPLDITGKVAVRVQQQAVVTGAATAPAILMGCLEGSTVRGRQVPLYLKTVSQTNSAGLMTVDYVYPGLTPGQTYTWDAAIGIETGVALSGVKYGGPNDAVTNNAWGSFQFSIHDTPGLLGAILYDPPGSVAKSIAALLAMTAFDTTNLRQVITVPPSGAMHVNIKTAIHGGTNSNGATYFGVLNGATVLGRMRSSTVNASSSVIATDMPAHRASSLITGQSVGVPLTLDAAYSVDIVAAATNLVYGGADDNVADNAFGGIGFEIWDAAPPAVQPIIRRRRF